MQLRFIKHIPITIKSKQKESKAIKQEPIFLITDILGSELSLQNVADNLSRLMPNTDIYISRDLRLNPENKETAAKSVDQQAAEYTTAIEKLLPAGAKTCRLAGYSFGVAIASKIASLLTNKGIKVKCGFIDSPTPKLSQAYLKSDHAPTTRDIILMYKIAAERAGLAFTDCSKFALDELMKLPIKSQCKIIATNLEGRNEGLVKTEAQKINVKIQLNTLMAQHTVIMENLVSLQEYKIPAGQFAEELVVCSTQSTVDKYECENDFTLGWKATKCAKLITSTTLFGDHHDILDADREQLAGNLEILFSAEPPAAEFKAIFTPLARTRKMSIVGSETHTDADGDAEMLGTSPATSSQGSSVPSSPDRGSPSYGSSSSQSSDDGEEPDSPTPGASTARHGLFGQQSLHVLSRKAGTRSVKAKAQAELHFGAGGAGAGASSHHKTSPQRNGRS